MPACGKTTYYFNNLLTEENRIIRINFDSIIKLVTPEKYNFHMMPVYKAIEKEMIIGSLNLGLDIYLDRTNLNRKARKYFHLMVQDYEPTKVALFFDVSLEICRQRNFYADRDKTEVEKQGIAEMYDIMDQKLSFPKEEEFDIIKVIDAQGKNSRKEIREFYTES